MGSPSREELLVASQVVITDLGLTSDQLRDEIAKLSTPDLVESPFGQLRFSSFGCTARCNPGSTRPGG
jgi:hypothetical protein